MIIGCNIWKIFLELNWLFYDPSWILQLSEFVWLLRSLVWVAFNKFLLIDATDKSKTSSDQKRIFSQLAYTHFCFSLTLPLMLKYSVPTLAQTSVIRKRGKTSKITFNLNSRKFFNYFNYFKVYKETLKRIKRLIKKRGIKGNIQ